MNVHRVHTGAYISSSPVVARTPSGVIVGWGGEALHLVRPDGSELEGWPRRGQRYFASSPSLGDVDGDGLPELFCGNDDDRLYGWRLDGSRLPGFPIQTGGDVYSSPALADLNGDGKLEIIFGSDDGSLRAVNGTGEPLPGWPQSTGHFVSASPTVADVDGDGNLEILVGSWDRRLYAWRDDGTCLRGWPVKLGGLIWSSATVADLDGDGQGEVVVASDQLYCLRADGSPQPGFPVATRSWMVSSPCVADADLDGHLEIGVGADRFYVFRSNGELMRGFPVDLGGYVWASPICVDIDGCGYPEWIVGSWDGALYVVRHDGTIMSGLETRTGAPIYSSAAFLQDGRHTYLAVGSWDTSLYILAGAADQTLWAPKPMFHGDQSRTGQVEILRGRPAQPTSVRRSPPGGEPGVGDLRTDPDPPLPQRVTYVNLEIRNPEVVRAGLLVYRISDQRHPSPFVLHRDLLRAMIHPLRAGTACSWHVELTTWDGREVRIPAEGELAFSV
jgi:hypothetical protein